MGADLFLSNALERDAIRECLGSTLTKLTLANISSLSDENLENLFATFQSLSDIDLSGCLFDFNLTNVNLRRILTFPRFLSLWLFPANSRVPPLFKRCSALEYLDVSSCFTSPKLLVNSVSSAFTQLTSLVLSGYSGLLDEDLNCILKGLACCLKSLDISSCLNLTDVSLSSVCTYSPYLETFVASWCRGFTDSGIRNFLFSLKHLKSVNLYGSVLLSVPSIAPQLHVLDISRSSADDKTIEVLTTKLSNTLRELFVSGCEHLTDQALSSILTNIPFLRTLDISFCPYISPKAVLLFKSSMPYLYYLKSIYVGSYLKSARVS
ncbi:unnamed protein product [Trichobilharzia regenti]|nr:unnamed protein product [Trichobilharzia regenti]